MGGVETAAVMRVREIAELVATLDDGYSAVADEVAAAWGHGSGVARFHRSSASHVFTLPGAFLRFADRDRRGDGVLAGIAELIGRLADDGLAVRPIRDRDGDLVASVATPLGVMHAMVLTAAPGREIEEDELTATQAVTWGSALATLHVHAAEAAAGVDLPVAYEGLSPDAAGYGDDVELRRAVERIQRELAELPRTGATFGPTHGDFELDNLSWNDGAVVAYDFDEAALSWYAADVEAALRDFAGSAMAEAFLAGYRRVRPLADDEVATLPLFAAARCAVFLGRLPTILAGAPADDDPPWVPRLCASLRDAAHRDRLTIDAYLER